MAAAGGALGVLCAGWTSRALLFLVPAERRPLLGTEIDVPILIFAAAVSAGTALLFGLAPAFLATRVEVLPALKQTASGTVTSDHPAHKIWSTSFVVVQVALSLVLLVGAMLFVRTLTNLQRQSLGLDDNRLLVFSVDRVTERLLGRSADCAVRRPHSSSGGHTSRRVGQRGASPSVLGLGEQRLDLRSRDHPEELDERAVEHRRAALRQDHRDSRC